MLGAFRNKLRVAKFDAPFAERFKFVEERLYSRVAVWNANFDCLQQRPTSRKMIAAIRAGLTQVGDFSFELHLSPYREYWRRTHD
jgi:hypothetical protein